MKLVSKFAFAIFVATAAVIALFSYLSIRRQVARIEESVSVDLESLGGGLRAAIVASWTAEGEGEALRIVDAARSHRSDVDIQWVSGVPSSLEDRVEERRDDGERRVVVSLPVRVDATRGGTLTLSRSVPTTGTILRNELGSEVGFALVLALVVGAIAASLGALLIGGPLGRIVAQARRVGAGDLSQRLRSDSKDEIGDLKRELNAMCDQLASARQKLSEEEAARLETLEQLRHLDRLRSVGTMASSIAHELGTPLNVLLLRGQSLVAGETEPDEIEGAGRTIVGQVEKMSRIVRQMLDFARPKDETRERFSASKIVEHAAHLLSGIAKKNGVAITTQCDADAEVFGHPSEIEQAVTNLMMNAIQAMPKGGALTLKVRTGEATPPNRAYLGTGSGTQPRGTFSAVMIDVRDDGIGMSAETLARIFEPFYTTKRGGGGTGLGLGVASGIAEDHGGFVTAESTLGKGSTFTLTLPRQ